MKKTVYKHANSNLLNEMLKNEISKKLSGYKTNFAKLMLDQSENMQQQMKMS